MAVQWWSPFLNWSLPLALCRGLIICRLPATTLPSIGDTLNLCTIVIDKSRTRKSLLHQKAVPLFQHFFTESRVSSSLSSINLVSSDWQAGTAANSTFLRFCLILRLNIIVALQPFVCFNSIRCASVNTIVAIDTPRAFLFAVGFHFKGTRNGYHSDTLLGTNVFDLAYSRLINFGISDDTLQKMRHELLSLLYEGQINVWPKLLASLIVAALWNETKKDAAMEEEVLCKCDWSYILIAFLSP